MLTTVVAVPAGYAVGRMVGLAWLAEPIRILDWGQARVVPYLPTILAAVIVLHFSLTRDELAREVAARAEAQRLAAESQLRLLRAQIEPHMLFNTLANLRSLIDEDTKQAQRMLDQLITYLRGALVASRTESTTLHREFAQLRAYLDLMSVRMGPRLTYVCDRRVRRGRGTGPHEHARTDDANRYDGFQTDPPQRDCQQQSHRQRHAR